MFLIKAYLLIETIIIAVIMLAVNIEMILLSLYLYIMF